MAKKSSKTTSRLVPVANVLQSLLENSKFPLAQQFVRWRLWRFWPEVVGPAVAEHTAPVDYERGRLIIWVSSSARLQEMTFVIKALQQKINDYIGHRWVTSIRFTLDRQSVPKTTGMSEDSRSFLSQTDISKKDLEEG